MNKKLIVTFILSVQVLFAVTPFFATAQAGGGTDTGLTYECSSVVNGKTVYGNCNFDDLIRAVQKFFAIAVPFGIAFTVVIIAYAGFLYMTSGGSASQRTQANKMFVKVAWGIFFMLAAWLIVTLITNNLLKTDVQKLVPLG